MSRLLHLNGAPGVGKSTLATRYAADHPGTLVLEIDELRTMVAGWEDDHLGAGARIRTAALAAITAYLSDGGDVVLPQLIGDPTQLARFSDAAAAAGATYVHVVLTAPADVVVARFRGRGGEHPWSARIAEIVDADGGDDALRDWVRRVGTLEGVRLDAGDPATTYAGLLAVLAALDEPGER